MDISFIFLSYKAKQTKVYLYTLFMEGYLKLRLQSLKRQKTLNFTNEPKTIQMISVCPHINLLLWHCSFLNIPLHKKLEISLRTDTDVGQLIWGDFNFQEASKKFVQHFFYNKYFFGIEGHFQLSYTSWWDNQRRI